MASSSFSPAEEDVVTALGTALSNLESHDSRGSASHGSQAASQSFCAQLQQVTLQAPPTGDNACASTACAICTSDYVAGDTITHLPCSHTYHTQCIQPWFSAHHTCPICRAEMPSSGRPAPAAPVRSPSVGGQEDGIADTACPTPAEFLAVASAFAARASTEPAVGNNIQRQAWEVHFGVRCSGCEMHPVLGNCFRCSTCDGADFCEACTAQHRSCEPLAGTQHDLDKVPGLSVPVAEVLSWLTQQGHSSSVPSRTHQQAGAGERFSEHSCTRAVGSASPSRSPNVATSGRSAFTAQHLPIALGQVVLTRGAGNSLRMSGRADGRIRP